MPWRYAQLRTPERHGCSTGEWCVAPEHGSTHGAVAVASPVGPTAALAKAWLVRSMASVVLVNVLLLHHLLENDANLGDLVAPQRVFCQRALDAHLHHL